MDEYDDGPYWVILHMYGSHDMRHTGFRRLTVVNVTLGFWGVSKGMDTMDFWTLYGCYGDFVWKLRFVWKL